MNFVVYDTKNEDSHPLICTARDENPKQAGMSTPSPFRCLTDSGPQECDGCSADYPQRKRFLVSLSLYRYGGRQAPSSLMLDRRRSHRL
jgi:hypothetical protein